MSKGLQWVIGIGVVLVVAAVIFSRVAPLFLPRAAVARAPLITGPGRLFGPGIPFLPGFLFGRGRFGPRMPFFSLFGLAACAWPLLLVGLIVFGISLLTRRPAPLASLPAGPVPPAPVSQAVCSQCGQPLQPGWRHCPNCGKAVGE
jgi:zinc-ribbon domain